MTQLAVRSGVSRSVRSTSCVRGVFTPRNDGTMLEEWSRGEAPADAVADFILYSFGLLLDDDTDWSTEDEFLLCQSAVIWNADGRAVALLSFRPAVNGESMRPVAVLVNARSGQACELTIERYERSGRKVTNLLRGLRT